MQSSLQISTTPPLAGAVMVEAINNALQSMATRNSGTEAPAVTYSFMQYADTLKGVLLRRNAANTGDILEGTLAETLVQARAANTMLVQADHLTSIIATGTFTQTFDAAATLGDGWSLMYRNNGTGIITLDPSGSETIDGATTIVLPAGASCVIACDGTGFYTFGRASAGGNLTGAINTAAFSVAAHATTCDIWTGGNVCTLTGSATTFTDVADAPQAGATRIVKCNAAHVFTDNANMDVAGGTFTAAAGDWLLFEAVTTSTFKVTPFKGDGTAAVVNAARLRDIDASVVGNDLTITINPFTADFRSTTLTDGTPVSRTLSSAVSLVVPNTATLGTINGQAARLAVLAIDNAGTIEAAVVNLAGGNQLDETNLISTTAISTGADSNNVIYSTIGRTNVAYRVVGFIDITEATAGTWATAPTLVQGTGGQALAALSSLGYSQTRQDVTASRALATTYINTTGRPIWVTVEFARSAGTISQATLTVGGVAYSNTVSSASSAIVFYISQIVMPGETYVAANGGNAALNKWIEVR